MLSQAGERAAELSLRSKGVHTPSVSRPLLGQETKAMPPVGLRKPSLTIQVWKPEGSAGDRTRKKWTEEKEEKVNRSSRAQKRRQMAEAMAGAGSLRPADDAQGAVRAPVKALCSHFWRLGRDDSKSRTAHQGGRCDLPMAGCFRDGPSELCLLVLWAATSMVRS